MESPAGIVGIRAPLVAGQLPVKDWHDFINDPALADAILDRLIRSNHMLASKGDSMWKRKTGTNDDQAALI